MTILGTAWCVWNTKTGEQVGKQVEVPTPGADLLVLCPDGRTLVTAATAREFYNVYDLETRNAINKVTLFDYLE